MNKENISIVDLKKELKNAKLEIEIKQAMIDLRDEKSQRLELLVDYLQDDLANAKSEIKLFKAKLGIRQDIKKFRG